MNERIYQNMHPVKVQIMKELEEKSKGKEMKQVMPLIMEAMQKLKENQLSFSQEEVAILLGILTKDMTPEEKQRVEMMKKMVREKGGKSC